MTRFYTSTYIAGVADLPLGTGSRLNRSRSTKLLLLLHSSFDAGTYVANIKVVRYHGMGGIKRLTGKRNSVQRTGYEVNTGTRSER